MISAVNKLSSRVQAIGGKAGAVVDVAAADTDDDSDDDIHDINGSTFNHMQTNFHERISQLFFTTEGSYDKLRRQIFYEFVVSQQSQDWLDIKRLFYYARITNNKAVIDRYCDDFDEKDGEDEDDTEEKSPGRSIFVRDSAGKISIAEVNYFYFY